ncbi:mCG144615, partial [Mus musculus]
KISYPSVPWPVCPPITATSSHRQPLASSHCSRTRAHCVVMFSATEAVQEDTWSRHQGDLCGRHDCTANNKYLLRTQYDLPDLKREAFLKHRCFQRSIFQFS